MCVLLCSGHLPLGLLARDETLAEGNKKLTAVNHCALCLCYYILRHLTQYFCSCNLAVSRHLAACRYNNDSWTALDYRFIFSKVSSRSITDRNWGFDVNGFIFAYWKEKSSHQNDHATYRSKAVQDTLPRCNPIGLFD